jgi:hypothetical protein
MSVRPFRNRIVPATALFLAAGSLIGQVTPATRYDAGPQNDTSFHPIEVTRQKVTTTTVLLTLSAKSPVPEMDLQFSGTTAELH